MPHLSGFPPCLTPTCTLLTLIHTNYYCLTHTHTRTLSTHNDSVILGPLPWPLYKRVRVEPPVALLSHFCQFVLFLASEIIVLIK